MNTVWSRGDILIKEERLARIVEYVQTRHFASVDELMSALGVSKATVRRDLNELSEENAILLKRGGAACAGNERVLELAYDVKRSTSSTAKNRLGEAACKLIKNGQAVILDAGTTTRAMTPFMKNLKGINLITNDIAIAADLNSCAGIDVSVVGGQLRRDFYTLRGYGAEEQIKNMRSDIAFVGFDAIDVESGCYITNIDEIGFKKRIIEISDKIVALCDHTKFQQTAFVSFCKISDIDVVVTERQVPDEIVDSLRMADIEVVLV